MIIPGYGKLDTGGGARTQPSGQSALAAFVQQIMAMMAAQQNAPSAASSAPAATSAVHPAQNQARARDTLSGSQALGRGFQNFVKDTPNVAVIDDFSSSKSHGNQIAGIIEKGDPNGNAIHTDRYNIGNSGNRSAAISSSLDNITQRVAKGQKIDAVNISQQDFNASGNTQAIQQKIQRLQEMGVPVVVAAGNGGSGKQNQLARGAAFTVENSLAGSESRAGDSGVGNIRSEGAFTSQATANVAARVALAHASGQNIAQIERTLALQAMLEGGALNTG